MGDKREFLQRYPPYVLLSLDAGSDIHYGKKLKYFEISHRARFCSLSLSGGIVEAPNLEI